MSIDINYLDSDTAIARIGGNAAIYTKLLKLFLSEETVSQLNIAVNDGNDEKVLQLAHALKGVCANLSLNKLKENALEIETSIKAQKDCKPLLDELNATHQKTIEHIHNFLNI